MDVRRFAVGVVATLAVFAPAAAGAQDYPGGPAEVQGGQQERGEVLNTNVDRGAVAGTQQTLPVTGGDLVGLTVLGAGLVGGGVLVVRRSRRRPVTA